jgi:hypothetical protein
MGVALILVLALALALAVLQMFLFVGANRNRGHVVSLSAYWGNKNTFFANRIRKLVFL